jgi:hypothetical protein
MLEAVRIFFGHRFARMEHRRAKAINVNFTDGHAWKPADDFAASPNSRNSCRKIRRRKFYFSPNRKKVKKSIAMNSAFDIFTAPRRP